MAQQTPSRIHHATVKKAAAAGFAIFERDGAFHLQATDDEAAEMQGDWETAAQAAQAAADHADPENEFELAAIEEEEVQDEEEAEGDEAETDDTRSRSGVMPIEYHKLYTANGGGCGDHLDQTLRAEFMGTEGLRRDDFIAFAKENGAWRETWATFNPGMIRMNTANVLRAKLRNDPDFAVKIPGHEPSRLGVELKPRKVRVKKALTKAAEADMAEAIAQAEPAQQEA
jgi:hypothetical protein